VGCSGGMCSCWVKLVASRTTRQITDLFLSAGNMEILEDRFDIGDIVPQLTSYLCDTRPAGASIHTCPSKYTIRSHISPQHGLPPLLLPSPPPTNTEPTHLIIKATPPRPGPTTLQTCNPAAQHHPL